MSSNRKDPSLEEGVRNGTLSLILKDGSRVKLQPNRVNVESRLTIGEKEEAYVLGEGSVLGVPRRDLHCSQGNFSKLMAFRKFFELPLN